MNDDDFIQNEVSKCIWPWLKQDGRAGKGRGLIKTVSCLLIGVFVAALLYVFDKTIMALLVIVLSSFISIFSLLSSKFNFYFELLSHKLAIFVGKIISAMLLIPIYYLIFSIGHIILSIRKIDYMNRSIDKNVNTYWVKRNFVKDDPGFTRQFS